ncbi:CHAT domain-containing protein [Neorhodopirellula pilleata]|uniref:CHAT domain-containing protein n=1 Tax=Neorhodopirellula pilleata TaxID=2714738 RepID=UPI0018CE521D|nr:CHAT domain-containing protein [Neorhodopirellula pilleata]
MERISADQSISKKLSRRLLAPLASVMKDERLRLVLSPDGELWNLPWAALIDDNDKFLIESFQIDYVNSGRDVLDNPSQKSTTVEQTVIFADPDFDSLPKSLPVRQTVDQNITPISRHATIIGKAVALPGTRREAESIRELLAEASNESASVFLGSLASETNFKALSHPKILVVSTHGFFLQPESAISGDSDADQDRLENGGRFIENPLLRCGLLLAGYNTDKVDSPADDGLLTGVEILNTDLQGTELVVLSACDTALGDVRSGEGVAGLRQAFRIAGAEAVMASLWQVEDSSTARLISDFFAQIFRGESAGRALRMAQLNRIRIQRQKNENAHPFFWAAFTLTGNRK